MLYKVLFCQRVFTVPFEVDADRIPKETSSQTFSNYLVAQDIETVHIIGPAKMFVKTG